MGNRIYTNPDPHPAIKNMRNFLRWRLRRIMKGKKVTEKVSHATNAYEEIHQAPEQGFKISWIGHSTFLIQNRNFRILTDPVWSMSVGGQRRLSKPGVAIQHLPPIDAVLISHNHFDHLDFKSIGRLKGRPAYLVPKGCERLFAKRGYTAAHPFAWGDSSIMGGVKFTFVPAQHWSRRSLLDQNRSLWGGWMAEDLQSGKTVYFAGDTAYFSGFRKLRERFSIDAALLPIGAFSPEWYMTVYHLTPEQAVQAFKDCGGACFIPMHYGSFRIADDTPIEALERLHAEWLKQGLPISGLLPLRLGESCLCP